LFLCGVYRFGACRSSFAPNLHNPVYFVIYCIKTCKCNYFNVYYFTVLSSSLFPLFCACFLPLSRLAAVLLRTKFLSPCSCFTSFTAYIFLPLCFLFGFSAVSFSSGLPLSSPCPSSFSFAYVLVIFMVFLAVFPLFYTESAVFLSLLLFPASFLPYSSLPFRPFLSFLSFFLSFIFFLARYIFLIIYLTFHSSTIQVPGLTASRRNLVRASIRSARRVYISRRRVRGKRVVDG
jgi:hypothetical protein